VTAPQGAPPAPDTAVAGRWERLRVHLADPLYRNGYALVASSGITSILGLVFWFVAARRFTPEVVGVGSATISAMVLLANLGQLNLVNALNRFVPRAGPVTGRLIAGSYAAAMALGGLAAIVFLIGLDSWSPDLAELRNRPVLGIWFVIATMAWTVFVLQDGALTGLRRATYVTVENLIYALAKLGLLMIPAFWVPGYALFLAWTLPLIPILAVVNGIIFARAVPRHAEAEDHDAEQTTVRAVARFAGTDYAASVIWTATLNVLPLIVLRVSGAEANAYFYLAWNVYYTLQLVSRYMGMSFVTEAALDRSRLHQLAFRSTVQTLVIVGPASLVVLVAAPLILSVFGDAYAREAGTLLRILAVAAIPSTIVVIYMAMLRVQKRMGTLLALTAAVAVLVVAPTLVLLPGFGLAGVGVAWLGAQTVIAGWLTVTGFRPVWAAGFSSPAGRRLSSVLAARRSRASDPALDEAAKTILRLDTDRAVEMPATVGEVQVALDRVGGRVLRLGTTPAGDDAVITNVSALEWWHAHPPGGTDAQMVPEVLEHGEFGGHRYSVETLVNGVALDRVTPAPALGDIVRPIVSLHHDTAALVRIDAEQYAELVSHPIGRVAGAAGPNRAPLVAALEAEFEAGLLGREVVVARIHGDLAPGNVLVDPATSQPSGIVDWERSTASLPDIDIIALLLTRRMGRLSELGDVVVTVLQSDVWDPDERALLELAPNLAAIGTRVLVLLTWLHHLDSNLSKAGHFGRNWVWAARNVDHVLDHV
jgi:O-antigen/teichoic acid export membrane protein